MIAHPFALHVPVTLDEALFLAGRYGDSARALSGGTVLLPELLSGGARPDAVIDLTRCGQAGVDRISGGVRVGAATTYRRLAAEPGLLGALARAVTGGPQIRNRATIGGSAAWANPSSDAPAVLVALEADVIAASTAGERRIPAADFFLDAFGTALRPGELLVAFELADPGAPYGYSKLKFGESSWPIVTAAAMRASGSVRVAVGGACARPFSVEVADASQVQEAVAEALVEPWSDVLAPGDYRRRVAPVIARRAAEALASGSASRPTRLA